MCACLATVLSMGMVGWQARSLVIAALLSLVSSCATTSPAAHAPANEPTHEPRSLVMTGANAVPLHYLDFSGRGDPVLLLAGAGNSAWIYLDVGKELARDHQVFALTRRGHGESGLPETGYDLDTLAEDIRLFLEHTKLAKVVLIGHSLAGAELTHFAGRYPKRVSSLVYLDAAYDRSTQAATLEADPIEDPAPTAEDRATVASFIDYVHRTRRDLARHWTAPVTRDLAVSVVLRPDGTAGWRTSSIFGSYWAATSAAAPEYSRVTAPALAIYAVESEAYRLPANATPELAAELAAFESGALASWRTTSIAQFRRGIPGGEVVEMDAGHHMFVHRPKETLELIRAFLARRPSADR